MLFNPWAGAEISPGVYAGAWVYHSTSLENKIRNAGYEIQLTTGYSVQNRSYEGGQAEEGESWLGETWDWMKEHFEISGGYELSYGWQIGGGWKKSLAAYIDLGSSVHTDLNLSNKRSTGGRYESGEKRNSGIGGAWKAAGVDFKRQEYQGVIENNISIGVLGILAAERSFNDEGQLTGWFWGINLSAKAAIIFGIEGDFKLGFSN
jgi:hypothetical protein